MRFSSLACLLPLCLVSCGDKSAVSLSILVDRASVTATDGNLGTNLGGSFELTFQLGPEASGSTTVTAGNFTLQNAAGGSVVDQLSADPVGSGFPVVVDKGGTQKLTFMLSSKQQLTDDQRTALCAGPVIIVGSVMDSLSGGTDSLRSNPITPTCS